MKAAPSGRGKAFDRSPRVARRRQRMRQALLAAGARQFVERGVSTVSVEELIAEADVSRATFYGLFDNKYSLLHSIVDPVFDIAVPAVRALADKPPAEALAGLLDVYVDLWASHREGLLLIPAIDAEAFRRFEAQHKALNEAMLDVLTQAERADLLRNGSARYSLKVVARTAIPLLRVYAEHPAAAGLFKDAMRGLLIRAH